MHTDPIHLIGAGGHGRVVADALIATGVAADRFAVRDGREGLTIRGIDVATPAVADDLSGIQFHIAVGSAAVRAQLYEAAVARGGTPLTVVHPAAIVAADAAMGEGSFIAAAAVVAPLVRTGRATIVNHGAIVDHDVVIGDFCHVAPNATLGGGVRIGNNVLIGSGTVVLPGVLIGDNVTIGAGAVVLADLGPGGTWVGNPARRVGD